jgi:hypothetical protein
MPSTGLSATTMTRSGAPVQGAIGDGRTVISAAFAQAIAAAAGDGAIEESKTKGPPATSKNDVAAAARRRARTIWT